MCSSIIHEVQFQISVFFLKTEKSVNDGTFPSECKTTYPREADTCVPKFLPFLFSTFSRFPSHLSSIIAFYLLYRKKKTIQNQTKLYTSNLYTRLVILETLLH